GLAGFFLNFDAVDSIEGELDTNPRALRLPGRMVRLSSGAEFREFDVPIVIQDKQFDKNGFLVFDTFDHNVSLVAKFVLNGDSRPGTCPPALRASSSSATGTPPIRAGCRTRSAW